MIVIDKIAALHSCSAAANAAGTAKPVGGVLSCQGKSVPPRRAGLVWEGEKLIKGTKPQRKAQADLYSLTM